MNEVPTPPTTLGSTPRRSYAAAAAPAPVTKPSASAPAAQNPSAAPAAQKPSSSPVGAAPAPAAPVSQPLAPAVPGAQNPFSPPVPTPSSPTLAPVVTVKPVEIDSKTAIDALQKALEKAEAQTAKSEAAAAKAQAEALKAVEAAKEQAEAAAKEQAEIAKKLEEAQAAAEEAQANAAQLKTVLEEAQAEVKAQAKKADGFERKNTEKQTRLETISKFIRDVYKILGIQKELNNINDLDPEDVIDAVARITKSAETTFEDEKAALEDQNTTLKAEKRALEAQNTTLKATKKMLKDDKTRLQAEKTRLQAEKTRLQAEKTRLQTEKTRLQAEKKRLQAALDSTLWAKTKRASGVASSAVHSVFTATKNAANKAWNFVTAPVRVSGVVSKSEVAIQIAGLAALLFARKKPATFARLNSARLGLVGLSAAMMVYHVVVMGLRAVLGKIKIKSRSLFAAKGSFDSVKTQFAIQTVVGVYVNRLALYAAALFAKNTAVSTAIAGKDVAVNGYNSAYATVVPYATLAADHASSAYNTAYNVVAPYASNAYTTVAPYATTAKETAAKGLYVAYNTAAAYASDAATNAQNALVSAYEYVTSAPKA